MFTWKSQKITLAALSAILLFSIPSFSFAENEEEIKAQILFLTKDLGNAEWKIREEASAKIKLFLNRLMAARGIEKTCIALDIIHELIEQNDDYEVKYRLTQLANSNGGTSQGVILRVLAPYELSADAPLRDQLTQALVSLAMGDEDSGYVCQKLVEWGASLQGNTTREDGTTTPLAFAAYVGHEKIFKCLIDAGAGGNRRDALGALTGASHGCRPKLEIVKTLIDHCDTDDLATRQAALFSFVRKGDLEIVKFLLHRGLSVNFLTLDCAIGRSCTPLQKATDNTDLQMVELLISAGADLNAFDSKGYTALLIASRCAALSDEEEDCRAVAEKLISSGADVNQSNNFRDHEEELVLYPILVAAEHGHSSIVDLFIKSGANLDVTGLEWRETALSAAARHIQKRTVELLLDAGANVNAKDKLGRTPLMNVLANNEDYHYRRQAIEDIAYLLLSRKEVDIKCQDSRSETALSLAEDNRHWTIFDRLRSLLSENK